MIKLIKFSTYCFFFFAIAGFIGIGVEKLFNSEGAGAFFALVGFFSSFYFAYKFTYKKSSSESVKAEVKNIVEHPQFELKVTTSTSSGNYSKKEYDDSKLENLYSKFQSSGSKTLQKDLEITLVGDSEKVQVLKSVISGHYKEYKSKECSTWDCEGSEDTLHYSVLKNEATVMQLSDLAAILKEIYDNGAVTLKESPNYLESGEHDQESILDEWREKFSDDFIEKCFNDDVSSIRAYDFLESYLVANEVEDYSIFKEYGFSSSKIIYDFAYRFERGEVFKSASDSYHYKDLKKLVDTDVLVSGLDIESEKLLQLLKVGEIRELAKAKEIQIKGRKKEDLLKSFLEQSAVSSKDIGKYVAVREIFAPNPKFMDSFDFKQNKETWERAKIIAEYVQERIHGYAESKEYDESFNSSFKNRFINSLKKKSEEVKAA